MNRTVVTQLPERAVPCLDCPSCLGSGFAHACPECEASTAEAADPGCGTCLGLGGYGTCKPCAGTGSTVATIAERTAMLILDDFLRSKLH